MMDIKTKRTISTLIGLEDAAELSAYYLRNANHLRPFEPLRSDDYHTLTAWRARAPMHLLMKAHKGKPIDISYV